MNKSELREMIREELQRVLKEGSPRKGSRVRTVYGDGVVLTDRGNVVHVKLDGGRICKASKTKVQVI